MDANIHKPTGAITCHSTPQCGATSGPVFPRRKNSLHFLCFPASTSRTFPTLLVPAFSVSFLVQRPDASALQNQAFSSQFAFKCERLCLPVKQMVRVYLITGLSPFSLFFGHSKRHEPYFSLGSICQRRCGLLCDQHQISTLPLNCQHRVYFDIFMASENICSSSNSQG